jgi:hypothetical protein
MYFFDDNILYKTKLCCRMFLSAQQVYNIIWVQNVVVVYDPILSSSLTLELYAPLFVLETLWNIVFKADRTITAACFGVVLCVDKK